MLSPPNKRYMCSSFSKSSHELLTCCIYVYPRSISLSFYLFLILLTNLVKHVGKLVGWLYKDTNFSSSIRCYNRKSKFIACWSSSLADPWLCQCTLCSETIQIFYLIYEFSSHIQWNIMDFFAICLFYWKDGNRYALVLLYVVSWARIFIHLLQFTVRHCFD